MKLKLVVASMSILGFVMSPAFAASHVDQKTTVKKHHHKMVTHHVVAKHDYKDYKDMGVQPAPVNVCTISPDSMTMDEMTQNAGRALPNPCNPGWFNRIAVSGGINVDIGKWGNRNFAYTGVNYERLSLNDAYLNLSGNINEWSKAFVALDYADSSASYNSAAAINTNVRLQQAYATLGNFDVSPVFVQVGKFYQDFGRYELYPVTQSMTQVLSQTLDTAAKIGFISNGFNGSVAAFDAPARYSNIPGSTEADYVASLGFDQAGEQLGFGVGGAYMYNFNGVDAMKRFVNVANVPANRGSYHSRVGAYALYGDVNSGPFSVNVNYTSATTSFNVLDVPYNTRGAKPYAVGVQAGFNFNSYMDKNQNIYVGYQQSGQASAIFLPKYRWLAGYDVDMWRNTTVGAEWDHDTDYSATNGGHGHTGNLVSLRAAVKFN